jgi:hypothetical protein
VKWSDFRQAAARRDDEHSGAGHGGRHRAKSPWRASAPSRRLVPARRGTPSPTPPATQGLGGCTVRRAAPFMQVTCRQCVANRRIAGSVRTPQVPRRGVEHIPTATSQTAAFGGRRNEQHTGLSRTLLHYGLGPPRRSQADRGQYFPVRGSDGLSVPTPDNEAVAVVQVK